MSDQTELEAMAARLAQSPDYRILRRLRPREGRDPCPAGHKVGLILDVETTGLDAASDEIIELGMVKFSYAPDDTVSGVIDVFSALNQPSTPIPADISILTGITNEMVAGQTIDADRVTAFAADAAIVIAHKAGFDRRFSERYWPVFCGKSWACSLSEIAWRDHGFDASALSFLLAGCGYFHESHRSVDDCFALLEVLAAAIGQPERQALARLLEQARQQTSRIWAKDSPFDLKDKLKARKYRWNDGSDGRPKSWFIDVTSAQLNDEVSFLSQEIYGRPTEPHIQTITALDRHSIRA